MKPGQEDRTAILKVLKDKRFPKTKFHTFKEIKARTGLDIRRVMDVTGHKPYDIIGTRQGYKHVSRATRNEILDSIEYLADKRGAMLVRMSALAARV